MSTPTENAPRLSSIADDILRKTLTFLTPADCMRTALEDARVRPVFSASPCGHRVRVRGTESVTDCNATEAEPGRHQCLPLRDLKFPPGV